MSDAQRPPKIGGIWVRQTKAGDDYCSLSLKRSELERLLVETQCEYISLVAWKNKRKEKDTHPDFEIVENKRQGGATASGSRTPTQSRASDFASYPRQAKPTDEPRTDLGTEIDGGREIPF